MAGRRRLDAELVRRQLLASRNDAATAVGQHRVIVNGVIADKAARLVSAGDAIDLVGPPPRFVSRGGPKLDAALDVFGVDVTGVRALDAGASTGGFTDCLLQRGASAVVALDVGYGQLHERLRGDERVHVIERCNVRFAGPDDIGGPVDLVVADLSFISLTAVMPALVGLCKPGRPMVLLVKPQFEAGRAAVSKGKGVVTDPVLHTEARGRVGRSAERSGCTVAGWTTSPITGADGNVEFLVHVTTPERSAR